MRCQWAYHASANMIAFHDTEWGKPQHNEGALFEMLSLMTFQAGMSWQLVLNRRPVLNKVFDNFDFNKIALFTEYHIDCILQVNLMIANRRKIRAVIHNAQVLVKLHQNEISLEQIVWKTTDNRVIDSQWQKPEQIPNERIIARKFAQKMKQYGFVFVGPKNMHAYLQTVGVINDHLIDCEYR